MTVPRMEDLDPATRREVERAIGRRSSGGRQRTRARPSTAGTVSGAGRWTCECGETFATWAAAERHPAGRGHTRVAATLEPAPPDSPVTAGP